MKEKELQALMEQAPRLKQVVWRETTGHWLNSTTWCWRAIRRNMEWSSSHGNGYRITPLCGRDTIPTAMMPQSGTL